jgi:hypothetical protein
MLPIIFGVTRGIALDLSFKDRTKMTMHHLDEAGLPFVSRAPVSVDQLVSLSGFV